jgi:hypothetical protein
MGKKEHKQEKTRKDNIKQRKEQKIQKGAGTFKKCTLH